MELPNIYKGNYRIFAIPALLMIAISLFFIPQIKLGVDFQGGTLLTLSVDKKIDPTALSQQLHEDGLSADVKAFDTAIGHRLEIEIPQSSDLVRAEDLNSQFSLIFPKLSQLEIQSFQNGSTSPEYIELRAQATSMTSQMLILSGTPKQDSELNSMSLNLLQKQFSDAYSAVFKNYQTKISQTIDKHVAYSSISVQTVSPLLSTKFIQQALGVVVMSAILSIVLVFLFFRSITPSIAVLAGALADVLIAMGAMGAFGIPFTLHSFAALLMLIGFSLDTDILLTTRILKRKGEPHQNAYEAMKTGMTMSFLAIVSFGILFVLATLTHISVFYEISAVALAGLVGDIFATWGINAIIVLHDVEKKPKSQTQEAD
ncbi:hypothetical protein HY990_03180 [Candidatus Micrarchaeota archaeon]|nr:hypothetical protein [Candidatus Micrarchaeota archaeon]